MNRDTTITLDQVHDGIVAAIQAKFPALHVEAYRENRKALPIPACLVELTELAAEPDLDPGTEQLAVMATFEALLVMGFKQPGKNPKLEIRRLAASFAAFALRQRWGCPIGPAVVIGAYPSDFEPELDQYEVWRVEWQQVLHLGETVWNDTGPTPSVIVMGQAPLIGTPYEGEYTRINEPPPTDVVNETTLVIS